MPSMGAGIYCVPSMQDGIDYVPSIGAEIACVPSIRAGIDLYHQWGLEQTVFH